LDTTFSSGKVSFDGAIFSGGDVDFSGAKFSGGEVDFSDVADWSVPPSFDFNLTEPPPGVLLPTPQADAISPPPAVGSSDITEEPSGGQVPAEGEH
jgi:Pentapeptide repeats (9 copies)